ncbi:MAG TPA: hypothetical protein VF412_04665 [Bdellovibrio sp.]|uniref:hypothetical protein n=1 Tax=Bdellovibrio sp. TaxID=28201 RepID=UPI002F0CB5A3
MRFNILCFFTAVFLSSCGIAASNSTSGTLTGTGTQGYIPYYSASSVLTNSPIYTTSQNVGIGTASPAAALDVNGHIGNSASSAPSVATTCAVGVSLVGNDTRGQVTLAAAPAASICTVTITFASAYASVPYCVFSPVTAGTGASAPGVNSVSTSAVVVDLSSISVSGRNTTYGLIPLAFNYICLQ